MYPRTHARIHAHLIGQALDQALLQSPGIRTKNAFTILAEHGTKTAHVLLVAPGGAVRVSTSGRGNRYRGMDATQ